MLMHSLSFCTILKISANALLSLFSREADSRFSSTFPYFHLHMSISEFVYHYVIGHQFVQHCTCKKQMHTILGYVPISQSNIMMASSKDLYCLRHSAMLKLGQWVKQCNSTMLGCNILFSICFHPVVLSIAIQFHAFITSG